MTTQDILEELATEGRVRFAGVTDARTSSNYVGVEWWVEEGKVRCGYRAGHIDLHIPGSEEKVTEAYERCRSLPICRGCPLGDE